MLQIQIHSELLLRELSIVRKTVTRSSCSICNGSSTDELIQLANDLSENPTPRELDMLLSAGERTTMSLLSMHLNSLGYSSFSLTGSQAGIITTSRHGQAEIEEITGERVKEGLENGDIVIVAGFQGLTETLKK